MPRLESCVHLEMPSRRDSQGKKNLAEIENVFSYRLQDAFHRGVGDPEWPAGELFRRSADAAAILNHQGPPGTASNLYRSNSSMNMRREIAGISRAARNRAPILCQNYDSWRELSEESGIKCSGGAAVTVRRTQAQTMGETPQRLPAEDAPSGRAYQEPSWKVNSNAHYGTYNVKDYPLLAEGNSGAEQFPRAAARGPAGVQKQTNSPGEAASLHRSNPVEKLQGPAVVAAAAGIHCARGDEELRGRSALQVQVAVSTVAEPGQDESGMKADDQLVVVVTQGEQAVNPKHKSPSTGTECGSLSKSSSDEVDPVNRRKTPAKNKSRRRSLLKFPHHFNADELKVMQRRKTLYGGSSSDENRSSGHATMSDSCSPPADTLPRHTHQPTPTCLNAVPQDDRLAGGTGSRVLPGKTPSRHQRVKDNLLEQATGIDDIKMAIKQLTLRSQQSRICYSTSTYSSLSGSEGGAEPVRRFLNRHSSMETINTNVTTADEFVWIDSYNRLVELQQVPWSNQDLLRILQNGRIKESLERVSMETIPRLSYLLQRALVRVAREAQRLARPLAVCSKREILAALKMVLTPALADSCIKACLRAAAMFTVPGADVIRQSKSARAGLHLSVGRFHRWMCDVRLGRFIHDYAAVYLTAGMENLLEEITVQCLPADNGVLLTTSVLEHSIAENGDLWALVQPYAHLNAGRTSTGALVLPRYPGQRDSSYISLNESSSRGMEQNLLTTCVGSIHEMTELLKVALSFHNRQATSIPGSTPGGSKKSAITWSSSALHALYYYMRCSQLEHSELQHKHSIQELVYERPYVVLPPLLEWVRVANCHAEYRQTSVVDREDVTQAARLLLPGVDCPIRMHGCEDVCSPSEDGDDLETSRKLKTDLAFQMLSSARSDLIPHALQLLPSSKINTFNEYGLTPLMVAALRGDETVTRTLLEAGADVNMETPAAAHTKSGAHPNPETQYWTALTYAAGQGHHSIAKLLLEYGANVEGGASLSEEKCTETPLQIVSASGDTGMVSLLLSYGAHPFLSTLTRDSLCYSSSAQKGCYSAIAVAAGHGQRSVLHQLLSQQPLQNSGVGTTDVLSLEEMLAEGTPPNVTVDRRTERRASSEKLHLSKLSKSQVKALQEAMYQSAENGHLDVTLDLRTMGLPWTLHSWMQTISTAYEQGLESITDRLLHDFLQIWGPEDYSAQFVDECLPLLFSIFRLNKSQNEGTTLLLADIFSTCFGKEPIGPIKDLSGTPVPRIDPKFVNNPELSDVQFRVEGRVFYGHKIVLVTASPRFKNMLTSRLCEGNPPVIQINDIRYDIFQMVMHFLYKGGCENLEVDQNDVLELMAAANFFQLEGLLQFCQVRCSQLVDLDNIVSMYIHAKVYNAQELLEYCQAFLLQNMVTLLTYGDSVRRLIFGKKLHNHDVLAGLLLTLQARVKNRPHWTKTKNK